jgi:hypothetical protein
VVRLVSGERVAVAGWQCVGWIGRVSAVILIGDKLWLWLAVVWWCDGVQAAGGDAAGVPSDGC